MPEKFEKSPERQGEVEREVFFQPKSPLQKRDCINRNTGYDCKNESTLEAVYGISKIRCCEDEKCKAYAATLAKIPKSQKLGEHAE